MFCDSCKLQLTPESNTRPYTFTESKMGRELFERRLSDLRLEGSRNLDTSGGTIQMDDSDVQLIVPPGAIPKVCCCVEVLLSG